MAKLHLIKLIFFFWTGSLSLGVAVAQSKSDQIFVMSYGHLQKNLKNGLNADPTRQWARIYTVPSELLWLVEIGDKNIGLPNVDAAINWAVQNSPTVGDLLFYEDPDPFATNNLKVVCAIQKDLASGDLYLAKNTPEGVDRITVGVTIWDAYKASLKVLLYKTFPGSQVYGVISNVVHHSRLPPFDPFLFLEKWHKAFEFVGLLWNLYYFFLYLNPGVVNETNFLMELIKKFDPGSYFFRSQGIFSPQSTIKPFEETEFRKDDLKTLWLIISKKINQLEHRYRENYAQKKSWKSSEYPVVRMEALREALAYRKNEDVSHIPLEQRLEHDYGTFFLATKEFIRRLINFEIRESVLAIMAGQSNRELPILTVLGGVEGAMSTKQKEWLPKLRQKFDFREVKTHMSDLAQLNLRR